MQPSRNGQAQLGPRARALRAVHNAVGVGELWCLGYLWVCALTRRRDRWLRGAVVVLCAEGVALVVARGCPLGIFQRRAGDDVPMFELWFGRRLAPLAIPFFTLMSALGAVLLVTRRPRSDPGLGPHGSNQAVEHGRRRTGSRFGQQP